MIYATGGVAYGDSSVNESLAFTGLSSASSASSTMVGWTAGGCLEYAFAANWSAKVEGMFYDLGTITATSIATQSRFAEIKSFNVEGAVARVGVNWRFGGVGWY
jgi:outer membrane immunogenic protein